MGYSNNKWCKILVILSIINLCFILFSKITKVFGYSSEDLTNITIDNNEYGLYFKYLTDNYKYFFINTQNYSSGSKYTAIIQLWCSDSPMTVDLNPVSGMAYYRIKSTGAGKFARFDSTATGSSLSWSNSVNYFNKTNFDTSLNGSKTWFDETYRSNSQFIGQSDKATEFGSGTNDNFNIICSNFDVKDVSGNIIFNKNYPIFNAPNFLNSTEIQDGYPDGVYISRGDYSENDPLYFHLLKINRTVPDGNQSTYYYDSKVFKLTKNSKYYYDYEDDKENKYSYYYVSRSALTLDTDSSYLYVISNNGDSINTSYGILQPDIPLGIYDVVQSDTAGVITEQQSLNDKIANINNKQQDISNSQQDIANNSNSINNFLNENTISNNTNQDIDTNLNFNNQNSDLNNFNNGFFSRLTSMLSNLLGYDLAEDTSVNIPLPNTNKSITLHSIDIYNNVTGVIRLIINAFWLYIFSFYMWRFINKIYIAVTTGNILDNFSSSGEAITNDML